MLRVPGAKCLPVIYLCRSIDSLRGFVEEREREKERERERKRE
jgi:hypothetical protein